MGGLTFSTEGHIVNLLLPVRIYCICLYFSYDLRFKIWFEDNIIKILRCFILYLFYY